MASSLSSSARRWSYDVFLSFRGSDTRKGITFDIYDRLDRSEIKTFMDNRDLEVGDVISPALLTAIRESRFAIVVLSQNYASSAWCLEELREICLSMEGNRILPLFYDVDPTEVRYQKKSFEDAFSKHETSERHESEKVKQWRAALNKVANISGLNTNDYKTHKELVDVVVESLLSKVPPDSIESTGDFQAYEATTQAMDEVKKALTDDNITAVGVYGMGGVGKTSMVRHVAAQACKNGTFNHWIMAAISPRRWNYDVFLSFRGSDTRKGITFDIYDRLNRSGIKTFMDDRDLEVGNVISPALLLTAIRESRFAIVVLSQNYASSAWCLEELREICLSMEGNRILPLFYYVDPIDVRNQRSFEDAFSKHETSERHESEKLKQWRAALYKVANISGWNTNDYKTHKELVDVVVESLRSKVPPDAIESTADFQAYEATTQAMDEVKKALTDDNITAVGVYGMGGVGKTSMVRYVAAQARKTGTFNHWIMVAISQSPDLRKIHGTLADLLGVKFEEETEDGRAATLHKEIMRRVKLLIILDDVWERTELSRIGIPSYRELQKCKSKVLLTTRRLNVCDAMKCQEKIALNILSEKDSWTLFLRNAGINPFESTTFENVARRVAGECKGLPIALIAVARALGDEDMEEWEKAAERLEKSRSPNPNHEEDAFKCIRLSYDYLKNEDHKSCFLLCCLYPEDHEIEIEDLFRYAIGKGLFRDAETMVEARGTVVSVVKYLKDSSLLLDSEKDGCVKMHDVIRDTAIHIAKSEDGFWVKAGCGLKGWPCRLHEGCTAISLMRNEIRKLPEEELVCPNLQMLLLKRNADLDEIPEKFIKSLNELRLLDLSHTSISSLPQSFSLLTNFQALYLDFCSKLIDISVVGKLKKLEVLSMRHYPGRELSREIGNLTNLRILDVSGAWGRGLVTIPSRVISKLHKLEELYILKCGFKDWGCEVEGQGGETNIGFDELAGLSNLKILQVCISDAKYIPENVEVKPNWVYFNICIGGHTGDIYDREDHNSRSLYLNGATISTLPDWFINAVTKKTEGLTYFDCSGMSDILMEYDHGRLHELKHLRVCGDLVYMKELMNTTRRVQKGPVFENLEEWHLIDLIHLEELCVGELPHGSLSNLKVLHIYLCKILKNVSKLVQRLPNLEKLYLTALFKLEYVFVCEGFEPKESKLREMQLRSLNSVKSICSGPAPRVMFQSLKILTICGCELLQSLFASDVAECLVQLEDLSVEQCPSLERVIEAVNNEKTVLPKLKNLVLENLPMLYFASATVDIQCPSLEHLIVVDCPHFLFLASSHLVTGFESRNRFSFSPSVSDYFGSTNPVQLNDQTTVQISTLEPFNFMSQSCPQKRRKQVRNLATTDADEGETKDLFDDLPNSILEFILSMLPIKDAVHTSMVSRRWRHRWLRPTLTRRNLEIDTPNFFGSGHVGPVRQCDNVFHSRTQKQQFARRVNAFLQLYQGNKLDSFKVTYFFNADSESAAILDEWIRFAITKGVEVLELRLFRFFPEIINYYIFPNWLLLELNSSPIKHLSLSRCALRSPVVDGFNQLRTLSLHFVHIDEEFMSQLFTVCLLLESLTLKDCKLGSRLIVAGPSLALNDFRVINCYQLSNFEIYAVNLTSLECVGNQLRIAAIRAPLLDNIFFLAPRGDDALPSTLTKFASSPRLKKLYLQMCAEIPQSLPTFRNLKQLNLDLLSYRTKTEDVDLVPVLNLLKVAPLLEELTITVVGSKFYKNQLEMRDLSGFTHDNLRKVKMQGFQSNMYEIEFVICILKNATKLQQIIIDPFGKLYFGGAKWVEVKSFGRENYKDLSWEERRRAVVQEKLKEVHSDAQIIIF